MSGCEFGAIRSFSLPCGRRRRRHSSPRRRRIGCGSAPRRRDHGPGGLFHLRRGLTSGRSRGQGNRVKRCDEACEILVVPPCCFAPEADVILAGSVKASLPATPCYFAWGCFQYFLACRAVARVHSLSSAEADCAFADRAFVGHRPEHPRPEKWPTPGENAVSDTAPAGLFTRLP
jgi:hypothetical protein